MSVEGNSGSLGMVGKDNESNEMKPTSPDHRPHQEVVGHGTTHYNRSLAPLNRFGEQNENRDTFLPDMREQQS
jgi:hypothetical protein